MKKNFFGSILPAGWVEETSDGAPENQKQEVGDVEPIDLSSETQATDEPVTPVKKQFPTKKPEFIANLGGELDSTYLEHVKQFLDDKNQKGIDYKEYADATHEMIEAGTSVEQAFRNAFMALKAGGLTFKHLIETNQFYVDALENELLKEFNEECDGIVSAKRSEVEKDVKALTDTQDKLSAEAEQIQNRLGEIQGLMEKNKAKLSVLNSGADKEEKTQASRKSKMTAAVGYYERIINDDLKKIQQFLAPQGGGKK